MEERIQKLIEPTIPGEFVFDVLQPIAFKGLDANALLRELGMDPSSIRLKGQRVSVIDYAKLIEGVIDRLDDGFLGFMDNKVPKRAFSVFASQLAGCTNLKEVFQQANRFFALFTRQFRLRLEEEGESAIVILEFNETQDFDYRFMYQSILLVVVRLINWMLGVTIRPLEVKCTFEKSHLDKYLRYLFDCSVSYSNAHNEVHFKRELLNQPCATTLQQVDLMLRDSTRMMLVSNRPAPFSRRVRQELVLGHREVWPSIEEVAEAMNISKNLLWRKLKKEHTSFLDIRDEVKRDYALSIIGDSELNISDVASKAGFADVSSFNKAFTKWTGQAPSSYRKASALSEKELP